jgi:cysteine-rich repeat protein
MKKALFLGLCCAIGGVAFALISGCSPSGESAGNCGNGVVDPGEDCDDGNNESGDGCDSRCNAEPDNCGDGVVQPNEACDDGNTVSGDGCRDDCLQDETLCGNGSIDRGEQCDDHNAAACDGCSATCQLEQGGCCGNGQVEYGEECDDGNSAGGDGCSVDCLLEICGNNRVDAGEDCDDGNTTPGDGCNAYCLSEVCGNNVIDLSESCDGSDLAGEDCTGMGYYGGTLACAGDCTYDTAGCNGMCGDSTIDASEQCDDGNTTPGDGCDEHCLGESGTCLVDQDLGALTDATPINVHVDTNGSHSLNVACGGTGREIVLQFSTTTFLNVTIDFANQTGHHVIGIFRAGQGDCDALEQFCFDTGGAGSGQDQVSPLPPGTWLLIVDASGAGDEGSVDITLTAQDAGLPCDNQFGSDTYYLGCELAGIPYEDITASGTYLACSDDGEHTITLPFNFSYYNVPYASGTNLRLGCNGGFVFNDSSGSIAYTNTALPYTAFNPFVALFWDDLYLTSAGQGIWYQTMGVAPNRRLIIQFVGPHISSSTSNCSIEVVLFESTNIIEFRYSDVVFGSASYDYGASATIGIQGDQTNYLQYSYNTASLADGDNLVFYPQF